MTPSRVCGGPLAEYEIAGVKTTIPFFLWLLDDADFLAARVDTTYLDRTLAGRNGEPFVRPGADAIDIALIAAALSTYEGARRPPAAAPAVRGWTAAARTEALR